MQYVNFGQTGLKISRLGFGGIPIQRIDQPGTRELLIAAHKAGVNSSTLPAPTRSARNGSANRWKKRACGMTSSWPPNAAP